MSAKAYKLKADATFSRQISTKTLLTGEKFVVKEGVSYNAGATITEDEMSDFDIERARAGELDHLLEPVDASEQDKEEPVPEESQEAVEAEQTVPQPESPYSESDTPPGDRGSENDPDAPELKATGKAETDPILVSDDTDETDTGLDDKNNPFLKTGNEGDSKGK